MRSILRKLTYSQCLRIVQLRNSHQGQHCFIIGDGVSLKYFDIGLFADRPALVSAKIPLHSEVGSIDARYWVVPEPMFCWPTPWTPKSRTKRKLHSPYNARRLGIQPVLHATNFPFTIGSKSLFIFDDFPDADLDPNFITRIFDGFSGSLNALISVAIYLGFSDAYLVGFDYTHSPSRNGHWYESGPGSIGLHKEFNRDFLEKAQEFISLTTVTLDGESETLPFITYQELTGELPRLRDQESIISQHNLQLLRKLDMYEI